MESKIYQSYGMPMKTAEEFGTNKNVKVMKEQVVEQLKQYLPTLKHWKNN
jgi:alanyl-tRNA synthetase